ncbi:MAG: hypothetical protein R6X20_04810 [Phycisphaerae bacterium]
MAIPEFRPGDPITASRLNAMIRALNRLDLRGSELVAVESGPFGSTVRLLLDALLPRIPKAPRLPIGLMGVWPRSLDDLPPDWAHCDGSTYNTGTEYEITTPDMPNCVVVGAGTGEADHNFTLGETGEWQALSSDPNDLCYWAGYWVMYVGPQP